jgi:hypothetical protein
MISPSEHIVFAGTGGFDFEGCHDRCSAIGNQQAVISAISAAAP